LPKRRKIAKGDAPETTYREQSESQNDPSFKARIVKKKESLIEAAYLYIFVLVLARRNKKAFINSKVPRR
jgi:hypothetical protein